MKRLAVSLGELASWDNLLLATWKAARGKRSRPQVHAFLADLDGALARLAAGILGGAVPVGRYREFLIHDPKLRRIHAACFEDRVLHHAILNLVGPVFERSLVDSSYACRPGMGSHAAVLRAQQHLRRHAWFGQVDVAGYFPAINHVTLKGLLARCFKGGDFLALLGRIIDGYEAVPGHGLPIGALTSQHFANHYLDGADRLLRTHPAVCAHLRYMDDMLWWCARREDVREVLTDLSAYLAAERGLCLKPAPEINRSSHGLRFCGYRIKPGTIRLTPRKQRRYRVLRTHWEAAWERSEIDSPSLQRAYDALLAPTLLADARVWRQHDLRIHPCLYDHGEG